MLLKTVEPNQESVEPILKTIGLLLKTVEPIQKTVELFLKTVRVVPKTIEPIRKTVGPVQKTVEPIRKAVELFPKQFNGSRKRFNGLEHSSMLCSSTVCITVPRFSEQFYAPFLAEMFLNQQWKRSNIVRKRIFRLRRSGRKNKQKTRLYQ